MRSIFKLALFPVITFVRLQHFCGRGRPRSRLFLRADLPRRFLNQSVVKSLGLPDLLRRIGCARVSRVQAHGLRLLLLAIDNLRLQEITQVVQILFFSIFAQVVSRTLLVNGFAIYLRFPRAVPDGILYYCCSIMVESALSVASA